MTEREPVDVDGVKRTGGRRSRLWFLLALPGIVGPLGIFGFIVYTETAHDPERCPYDLVGERALSDGKVTVLEERRRCLRDVEERRYSLRRGEHHQVLGRRRFAPTAFAGPEYGWDAGISDAGEVHVAVRNPGHPPVEFREGRPDER